MSSDDFKKRLERIEKRSEPNLGNAGHDAGLSAQDRKPVSSASPTRSVNRILGGLLAAATVATVAVFALFGTDTLRSGAADAATSPASQTASKANDINWWDRIVLGLIGYPGGGGSFTKLAASHLPAAPEGWILVTTEDVLGGGGYDRAAERYAALNPTVSFENNLGQNWLASLIRNYETPDFEANVYKETKGRGIYMSRDGHFLYALLEFRSQRNALAPEPENRNAQLLKEIETGLSRSGKDKVANELDVDGIQAVAITDAAGQSLVSRPLSGTLDVVGGFELHAALDHRSVMVLRGMAVPAAAFAILSATDHKRLAQR